MYYLQLEEVRSFEEVLTMENPKISTIDSFTLSLCQLNSVQSKQENIQRVLSYATKSAKKGANLIVFPELSLSWYIWPGSLDPMSGVSEECIAYMAHVAEPIPGSFTQSLSKICATYNCYIIAGLVEKGYANILYNSAVLVGPSGIIGVYRKTHLPRGEQRVFAFGDRLKVFETPLGRIGLIICYDWRFPEVVRALKLMGAQIIVHITAWGTEVGDIYNVIARSQADANKIWLASCNKVGTEKYSGKYVRRFWGNSLLVNPAGAIVEQVSGDQDAILYHTNNFIKVVDEAATTGLYFLKDRRPELYHILQETTLASIP